MADEKKNEQVEEKVEAAPVAEERPAASDTTLPAVSGPADLVVGDEDPREREVYVVKEEQDAMVVKPREPDHDKVQVHEVAVVMDERVDYVIVPEAGRGFLDLPIHRLDGERPEDVFAREASGDK
jgi:hypothetical protein